MQRFLREANAFQERQRRIVEGLRGPFAFETFRTLLEAEGFAILPRTLAARMRREAPAILVADEKANHRAASTLQPIGGVCTEVLDLLHDCVVPPKMFGLLRKVVAQRQVEIAQLMIALVRVKLNFARVLIALTPLSQRTDPSLPSKRFGTISATQLSVMEIELGELTQEFLVIAERDGMWNLEYMAALGYLNRLMDSPKVVRYLAQKFPAQLAELQNALDTASSVGR